jgi:hypothetical protein
MVEATKTRLVETVLVEPVLADGPGNRKSPLTGPEIQELHLISATVISTYDLAIGAPQISQSATLAILNPKLVCKKR